MATIIVLILIPFQLMGLLSLVHATLRIRILPFNTHQGKNNRFQHNFRNHRKLVVVDGKATWTGGLNVGDDYLDQDPKLNPWRDTHMRIQGPATLPALVSFISDWYWAGREFLPGISWLPQPVEDSDKKVLVLASGPADVHETASRSFRLNIEISGVVADRKFTGELEKILLDDMSHSTELFDYSLDKQSYWERIKARACVLLAPAL